ncbi:MAG: 2,3-bisphosphoglycerate-independent phosphoglycerate mutase [Gammaproteobacteria bacterium]
MSKLTGKPVVLVVLDGWGCSEHRESNAILNAETPTWDRLWHDRPHLLIRCSGTAVGLPGEQMGNSEVGHLNLGAGRVVYQEFTRISRAIKSGTFFTNRTLTQAVDHAIAHDKAVHILGLLSPGGVHSHEEHIQAMAKLAVERGAHRVYLHAFLDGRDMPPKSAAASLQAMQETFAQLGCGRIASIIGRYFAMDRDNRWPRIEAAYDLLTQGKGHSAADALTALDMAYARGESDEFVQATAIVPPDGQAATIGDGDSVIFMNYRSDRARQITRAFIEGDFTGFQREVAPKLGTFVSLTEYNEHFHIPVAFPPERVRNTFGEYIANLGLHQLRIAETEKYAHVTFFFNGGIEQPYAGEDRILVPSPSVATYDLKPEMSALEVTDKLVAAIEGAHYDAIICNYANPDMVGHTGSFEAAVKAVEVIDQCLARLVTASQETGTELIITADHGNVEQMRDETANQPHTAHTRNLAPFIYVGRPAEVLRPTGSLADIAPTMLCAMGLDKPAEMSGQSLLKITGV